uniref:SH3 domain-containing protein n=1 Tax=Hydatigena taeniaeformis TaxID=6205 RepID=A0A0R3WUI6_HYDTA
LKQGMLLFAEKYYPSLADYIRQWDDNQSSSDACSEEVGDEAEEDNDDEDRRLKRGLLLLAQKYYPPLATYLCHCNEKHLMQQTHAEDDLEQDKHYLKRGLLLFADKFHPTLANYIRQCDNVQLSHGASDVTGEDTEEQLLKKYLLIFSKKFYPILATYIRHCEDNQLPPDVCGVGEDVDASHQCSRLGPPPYATPSETNTCHSNDDQSISNPPNVDEEDDEEQRLKQGLLLLTQKYYPSLAAYICQCDDYQPSPCDPCVGEERTEEQRLKQSLLLFAKKFYPCLATCIRQCDGTLVLNDEFIKNNAANSNLDAKEGSPVDTPKIVCNEVNEVPFKHVNASNLSSEVTMEAFEKVMPPTGLTVDTSFRSSLCHSLEGGFAESPYYVERCTVESVDSTAPLSQSSSTKLYFSNTEEFTTEEGFSPTAPLSIQRRIRIYLEDLENTDKFGNPQEEIIIDSNLDSCTDESKLSSVDVEFTMEQRNSPPLDLESQDEDLKNCVSAILKHIWSELVECIRREGLSDIYELSLGDRRIEVPQDDICLVR